MLVIIEGIFTPFHLLLLLVIGILLSGNGLPKVGRSVGKRIVEFKEGRGRRPPPAIL
jgi:Sec-independent protein translocase protein TatA